MTDIVMENGGKGKLASSVLKIMCVSLLCALFIVACCYLIIAPASSYISVEVSGQPQVGIEEILSIAEIRADLKWSEFDAPAAEAKLRSHPLFSSAHVDKKFPDRVVVSVEERVPVAVAVGDFNGRSVPVEIDRDGVIFRVGATNRTQTLPLITGINMINPVPGSSLNSQLRPFLRQLEILVNENPRLLASVSEIKIVPKTYGSYDLVLFPVHMPVPVKTDKALNEDALEYMMLVLDVVKDLDISVREIDIRAGTVAYTLDDESV